MVILAASLGGCATGRYTPLGEVEQAEIEQLKENLYRVEYRVSAFTSQEQLDRYLRRRCAELTLREGYDFFHLAQRADVLGFSRRTAVTVTLYTGHKPVGVADLDHSAVGSDLESCRAKGSATVFTTCGADCATGSVKVFTRATWATR